jgi:hypothetical protein
MNPRARRLEAEEYATEMLEKLRPARDDEPYVRACIREAYQFEDPPQALEAGLSPVGPIYNLTFKRFRQTFNFVEWVHLFFGRHRDPQLCNVAGAYIQLTNEGPVPMLELNKVALLKRPNATVQRQAGSSNVSSVHVRTEAQKFAKNVMSVAATDNTTIAQEDAPYIEAVIVEAIMFEQQPDSDVRVTLIPEGHLYNIIFQGYKSLINVVRWVNTFLGMHRDHTLSHVITTFAAALPEEQGGGWGIFVQMNKIDFKKQEEEDDYRAPVTSKKRRVGV